MAPPTGLVILLFFSISSLLTAWNPKHNFRYQCLSSTPEAYVANSSRTVLEYVTAGSNLGLSENDPTCTRPNQTVAVDICRVGLSIPTSNRSSISFELWLPEEWSGRFLATGNGGIDGCIKYEDLVYGTRNSFATVGSNNGHNGTTAIAMYQNPDVVTDFAWRSLHTSTNIGQKLVNLFYHRPHQRSYYIGCSLGGRQGVKAAEMFPGDFDGIVAGSPALDFNNLQSWRASFYSITGPANSSDFISKSMWSNLIHEEILNQCDTNDGVRDGIIEDPNLCNFSPEKLLCKDDESTDCLNVNQVKIVRKIFSPLIGEDGHLLYPAMQPGSEIMASEKLYAGTPFPYSQEWFKYVIYTPNYTTALFTPHDATFASTLSLSSIRTYPSSLSTFRSLGGKILLYHGGQDNQITSYNTERFYTHLLRGMNASSGDLDTFLRFFRVPGMFHCNSGPGAWVLGQGGGASAKGVGFDREGNVLAAVVAWVEEGEAVENIVGTKFVDDSVRGGVEYRHRHCKYPARSTYQGGDPKMLDSWRCL